VDVDVFLQLVAAGTAAVAARRADEGRLLLTAADAAYPSAVLGDALRMVEALTAGGRHGEAARLYRRYTTNMRELGVPVTPMRRAVPANGSPWP
jgi:hypothetical protein